MRTFYLAALFIPITCAAAEQTTTPPHTIIDNKILPNLDWGGKKGFNTPYIKVFNRQGKLIYASNFMQAMIDENQLSRGIHETMPLSLKLKNDLDILQLPTLQAEHTVLYFSTPICPPCESWRNKVTHYLRGQLKDFRLINVNID